MRNKRFWITKKLKKVAESAKAFVHSIRYYKQELTCKLFFHGDSGEWCMWSINHGCEGSSIIPSQRILEARFGKNYRMWIKHYVLGVSR